VFIIEGFFGHEWEERKIMELLGEKQKRGALPVDEDLLIDDADDQGVSLAELLPDDEAARRSNSSRN